MAAIPAEDERAEILQWTEALTHEAGELAKQMLAGDWAIVHKADGTVVTDIDRQIERFLRDRIGERFPGHAILGEEFGFDGDENAPLWALDPVDGTTNLANGLPQWGVSVGLIAGGTPIVGAVAFPMLGQTYAGALGLGATRNGARLALILDEPTITGDDVYGICSYSVHRMTFDLMHARLRLTGSAALDACWTADGSFRGSQSLGVKLYDVAGGFCIAHEAGAVSRWLKNGEPWSATDMLRNGKRTNDLLLTGPPKLVEYLRGHLALQPGKTS